MTERFVKLFEDKVFYIVDTKNLKTLEDFENELKEKYRNNGIGYNISIVQEIAKKNYNEYLYENSMSASEITEKLNKYYNETECIKKSIIESIETYLEIVDEQEELLLGNVPQERASSLIELLTHLGLHELLDKYGVEL